MTNIETALPLGDHLKTYVDLKMSVKAFQVNSHEDTYTARRLVVLNDRTPYMFSGVFPFLKSLIVLIFFVNAFCQQ